MLRFAIVLLLISAVLCARATFEGVYTDSDYGDVMYVCVDDDDFYAFYSEVGLAIGSVTNNGNTVTGHWYEGGVGDCVTGPFELNKTPRGFIGTWQCEGDSFVSRWDELQIAKGRPSNLKCGRLDNSERVPGKYSSEVYEILQICEDDNKLVTSYRFGNTLGYEKGYMAEGDRIAGGSYCENDGDCGSTLWFSVEGVGLVNTWWADYITTVPVNINDDSVHGLDFNFSDDGDESEQFCHANQDLSTEVGTVTVLSPESVSTAPSASSVPSVSAPTLPSMGTVPTGPVSPVSPVSSASPVSPVSTAPVSPVPGVPSPSSPSPFKPLPSINVPIDDGSASSAVALTMSCCLLAFLLCLM